VYVWISAILLASGSLPLSQSQDGDAALWKLGSTTVMAGGPAVIVLTKGAPRLARLQLCIEGRDPIPLDTIGPVVEDAGGTIVLVAHDLATPEGIETASEDQETFRFVPVFNSVGTVALTLRAGGQSLGTLQIKVIPLAQEADEALALLYPSFKLEERANRNEGRWLRLLVDTTWQGPAPIDAALLQTLKNDLPVISQHPDWAEIARFLVAYREAQAAAHEVTLNQIRAARGEPTSQPAELSEWAQGIFATQPTNRFAQAIKAHMQCQLESIQRASP
jgi:hypothetical protein